jgi:homoserine kinase
MIKIQVPATSANLGSGFDSLGISLKLYNRVLMEEFDGVDISTNDGSVVPVDESNLVYTSAKFLFDLCGRPFHGLKLVQENNIPMTRGLGSSSACIVAGLVGANALLNNPLSKEDLVNLAARLEGHPDNSTPAILGGLVTAVFDGNLVYSVKVPISGRLKFAAFIPDFELKTEVARAALPEQVPHRDAVYNLSRAALMTASLFSGRLDNLRIAAGDKLHQPYRLKFIKDAEEIFNLAYKSGAYAACISGAGPTLLAMVNVTDLMFADHIKVELASSFPGWQLRMLDCDEEGATVQDI